MGKGSGLWKVVSVLSFIGILLALFLLYNFFAKTPSSVCHINDKFNCDAVTKGSISTLFGIPVALYGLLGYITIFVSSVYKKAKLAFGVTVFGMLFCLRLTFLEIFVIKVLCPVCLTCQTIMFIVFILTFILTKKGREDVAPLENQTSA